MKRTILAMATSIALSGTVFAADAVDTVPAAAPAPVASYFDWSGLYAGAVVGYGFGDNHYQEAGGGASVSADFDGALGGATLGFNFMLGANFLAGIEADIALSGMDATSTTSPTFGCGTGCVTELDYLGTVRGRLGYVMGNNLFFATGGLAYGNVAAPFAGFQREGVETGWTAGAGYERAFTNRVTGKIEYLYTDLGSHPIAPACAVNCFTDVEFSTVRAGINFHF